MEQESFVKLDPVHSPNILEQWVFSHSGLQKHLTAITLLLSITIRLWRSSNKLKRNMVYYEKYCVLIYSLAVAESFLSAPLIGHLSQALSLLSCVNVHTYSNASILIFF